MTTFRIGKTGDLFPPDVGHPPCEEAVWREERREWVVAIPTLAKLLKFTHDNGGRIVLEDPYESDVPQLMRLEIYDGYRE